MHPEKGSLAHFLFTRTHLFGKELPPGMLLLLTQGITLPAAKLSATLQPQRAYEPGPTAPVRVSGRGPSAYDLTGTSADIGALLDNTTEPRPTATNSSQIVPSSASPVTMRHGPYPQCTTGEFARGPDFSGAPTWSRSRCGYTWSLFGRAVGAGTHGPFTGGLTGAGTSTMTAYPRRGPVSITRDHARQKPCLPVGRARCGFSFPSPPLALQHCPTTHPARATRFAHTPCMHSFSALLIRRDCPHERGRRHGRLHGVAAVAAAVRIQCELDGRPIHGDSFRSA